MNDHVVVKAVQWFFDILDGIVNVLESTAVNTVSALTPWLAPIIPASLVYDRLMNKLGFLPEIALIAGMVIEFIGLSSVSTVVKFWRHNKYYSYVNKLGEERVSRKKKVPIELPVATFIFYLFVVISSVVLLELPVAEQYEVWIHILVLLLLCLLSVPGAIIIASRAMYHETLSEMEEQYKRRQKEKRAKQLQEAELEQYEIDENSETFARPKFERRNNLLNVGQQRQREKILAYVEGVYAQDGEIPGPTEVSQAVECSLSYAHDCTEEWKTNMFGENGR